MSKELSVKLDETVTISESHREELELDAIIYRNEFEKYRQAYLVKNNESDLIFSFIFLQIYIECFLHQNMRRIIGLEFKHAQNHLDRRWLKQEKRFIPDKINNFHSLFLAPLSPKVLEDTEEIEVLFKAITSPRNEFAHGHKVASWFDSNGGKGNTKAKELLTRKKLHELVKHANSLGELWNNLLDAIFPRCVALQQIQDFKFENFKT